jgi:TM2 domain-containing membrane protein YozV
VAQAEKSKSQDDTLVLKDPGLAALMSWLIPGSGQIYQGRTAKGILFMVCILGTFFYGLHLGGSAVVHASWKPQSRRLPYICQFGLGLPAMPALVQSYRMNHGKAPLWNGFMAPPQTNRAGDGVPDELDEIHDNLHRWFELGTAYTMIAGLLNILVIFDAWGGPAFYGMKEKEEEEKRKKRPKKEDGDAGKKAEKSEAG